MDLLSFPSSTAIGPAWLEPLRDAARLSIQERGLPTKKHEAWRFTNIAPLIDADYQTLPREQSLGWTTLCPTRWRILVHGGKPILSPNIPQGISVYSAENAHEEIKSNFGKLASNEDFNALNSACFEHTVILHVSGTIESAVEIEYQGKPGVSFPRVFVMLEENAVLNLVERASGESDLSVAVTEILLKRCATLNHFRIHQDRGAFLGALAVRQNEKSNYQSHVFSFTGNPTRLDLHVDLVEPHACTRLNGTYLLGSRDHVAHHLRVDHRATNCSSHQLYRGVLDEKASGVFDGQAIVHRNASGSEVHQRNRNLLLSDTAKIHTKPHLEVDHDEVVASHGATVGALDPQQIFYLRSRGIPEDLAQQVLTLGFLREMIDAIILPELKSELMEELLFHLPHSEILRGFER